jgi:hypothetical protein
MANPTPGPVVNSSATDERQYPNGSPVPRPRRVYANQMCFWVCSCLTLAVRSPPRPACRNHEWQLLEHCPAVGAAADVVNCDGGKPQV